MNNLLNEKLFWFSQYKTGLNFLKEGKTDWAYFTACAYAQYIIFSALYAKERI